MIVLRNGQYTIVGEATSYRSLDQLVDFHQRIPILPYNEILTVPCGQVSIQCNIRARFLHEGKDNWEDGFCPK